jgi:hypothetical protein
VRFQDLLPGSMKNAVVFMRKLCSVLHRLTTSFHIDSSMGPKTVNDLSNSKQLT